MNGRGPALIKKYGNRRLYDTDDSRYLTLEELAVKIRSGRDVRIIDAKSEQDITQATLAQLIFEGETSKLLPVNLLTQLIRLGDDSVGEFFGRYVTWALDLYMQAKRGVHNVSALAPGLQSFPGISQLPAAAVEVMNRMWMNNPLMQFATMPFGAAAATSSNSSYGPAAPAAPGAAAASAGAVSDIDALRKEIADLRRTVVGEPLGKPGAKRKPLK